MNHFIERTPCLALSRVWRQFFNLENKTFTNSDRSTSNARLKRVVLHCIYAHSAYWLTHLARYKNSNSIQNKQDIRTATAYKTESQPTSLVSHPFSTIYRYLFIYLSKKHNLFKSTDISLHFRRFINVKSNYEQKSR